VLDAPVLGQKSVFVVVMTGAAILLVLFAGSKVRSHNAVSCFESKLTPVLYLILIRFLNITESLNLVKKGLYDGSQTNNQRRGEIQCRKLHRSCN